MARKAHAGHPTAYADREYRTARQRLRDTPAVCIYCGAPATQLDHVPPLALHEHQRGSGCCELHPACVKCNSRGGQRIAQRKLRLKRATKHALRREVNASREW